MKSRIVYTFFILFGLFMVACEETPPFIDYSRPIVLLNDTTYLVTTIPASEDKRVLVEDLSGVRCVNCPDANATAKAILAKNPEKVVVLTLFPISLKIYTTPYEGEDTLANEDAENIMTQIMQTPTGLPSGAVDRKKYIGEASITMSEKKWEKYVNDQQLLKAKANLTLGVVGEEASRKITANVKVVFTEAYTTPVYLTLMIVEDEIESKQLTRAGEVETYIHHHVLRKCVTPYNGLQLAASVEKVRVFEKGFEITIPEKYNFKNCSIVALINQNDPDNKEIIQAIETKP
jgi:hypothetical protein